MIRKATFLFATVVGLMLSVTYGASGSPINVNQVPQESLERSAAVSGFGGPCCVMAALDPCDVDFNENGIVDVGDIMHVASRWRSTEPAAIVLYDFNDDGAIDIVDIMLVAVQWGKVCFVSPFAIDLGGYDTDPTRRDLAVAAGFRLHRTSVSWSSIEPNEPVNGVHTYYWPDGTFNFYRNDRRLMPYVIIMNNPSWAVPVGQPTCGPIDPAHLGDFGEFVSQLVSRYADVTTYWVLYNEQDQRTTVGNDAGGCWGEHGAEYAQMLAVAWDAAHSADLDAQVIFGAAAYEPVWDGGSTWDQFFYRDAFQYMQANPRPPGHDYVDIIAANQYNAWRDDWDGTSATLPENQEIIAKFRHAVSDASFASDTPGAYSVARWQSEYDLDKPMASGEVGLQVSTGPVDVPTMEEFQARHAVHVNVRGMAAGLRIISWYTLVDKGGGELNYGLLYSDLTPRPAYTAYQVLTQQLDRYVFDQQLLVSGQSNIQAYRFDKDGIKKLVLWRDDGLKIKQQSSTATETMTVSAAELGTWTGQVRVTDKLGNSNIYSDSPSVDLDFSSDPIYVEAVQ